MTNENVIKIKLTGSEDAVLKAAKKIESLFPICVSGRPKENDNGVGVHLFLTVSEA